MDKKRILVCGAGGFIGSHLARELYRQGHFVRVIDLKYDGYLPEPYYSEKIRGDLRQYDTALHAAQGMDWIFQLAADMGGIGYITEKAADVVYNNALINLNMAKAALYPNARVFFASSACIYPNYKQEDADVKPLAESDAMPADPNEAYGWEKLFSEIVYQSFARDYGLDIRIARFHNVYGPFGTYDGGREKAPAALCRKVALADNPGIIEVWGDGKATRSFCYIDDCVNGIQALMESDWTEPINIGSDRLVTVDELAELAIAASGKDIQIRHDVSKPQGVRGRNADLTLVKQVLGWWPTISLEIGMDATYRWIAEQVKK
jgi:nucleoside-diphosphate-sugar epimerase